jgi:hypothetical protein
VDPGDRISEHGAVAVHGIRPVDLVGASSQKVAKAVLSEALDRRILVAWHATVEAAWPGSSAFPRGHGSAGRSTRGT